jgi:hypothetical protein
MGSGALPGQAPGSLIGRDDNLEYITAFVDQAAVSGGALLLSGEAGVGKTVLLDAAAAHAETAGSRVLRAAGAEFEGMVTALPGLTRHLLLLAALDGTGCGCACIGATLTAEEWLGVMASLQPAPDLSELVPWLVDGLPTNDAADVLAMFPPALAQRYRGEWQPWYNAVSRW